MDLTLAINAGTVWYPKYTFRSTLARMRVGDGRSIGGGHSVPARMQFTEAIEVKRAGGLGWIRPSVLAHTKVKRAISSQNRRHKPPYQIH